MYNYHGQCDLIYTTCPNFDNGKGLHLHLRTEFVLPRKWSTISGLAIKLGDDVFEVQNNGNYYLNGEANVELDDTFLSEHKLSVSTVDGPKFTRSHYTTIVLNDIVSLIITQTRSYKRDSIGFQVHGVHEYRRSGGDAFDNCVGLSSSWDHPEKGEFLIGRSGAKYTKQDAIDFGPEWQVDLTKEDPMLFVENIGQHLPDEKCIDSPLQAKDQRHLKALYAAEGGALARQAEEACSHLNGNADLFDACFYDVLVTGDASFAQESWYN